MIYEFECSCGKKVVVDWPMERCSERPICECGKIMARIWGTPHLKFIGRNWPSQEVKLDREELEIEKIMSEPVCESEIKAGKDMLKEREKYLKYEEGQLTGQRKVKVEQVAMETKYGKVMTRRVVPDIAKAKKKKEADRELRRDFKEKFKG